MERDADEKLCLRCRVEGRVQGVFYRASARHRALELGVSGFARNLSDGSVEVRACGARAAVAALRDWLWEGPSGAAVTAVQCRDEPYEDDGEFTTG